MKFFKRAKKLFAVLSSILMLVQPILPVLPSLIHPVYAEEATASSEQTTPAPTEEITPTPTEEVSPTPTEEVTPTVESTPTETPIPTETVEPTAQPEADRPLDETTEPPKETGPPADSAGQILDGAATEAPSPTIATEPTEEGNLQAVVLQNVEAESLNLDNVDPSNSATLTTDKADYAPTDTAVITGTGFTPGETYTLTISSDDPPPTSTSAEVTADENGSFVYAYQLDGTYRPNYKVEAKSNSVVIAETSFTDSDPKITAKTHQGQKSDLSWTSGNVTSYQEGDTINFRFNAKVEHAPASGQLEIQFSENDGTCLFFDNYFVLGSIENISGTTPSVSVASGPIASSGEWVVTLNLSGASNGEGRINYQLRLSNQAGQCNGSSQHSRLNPAGGDVVQSGQQNVPVPANQVIELPDITITKQIDRDGNGSFESTASADEYAFTLDGTTTLNTDASGQVVFINVTPNGSHTITESQLDFSLGTYSFFSGSGSSCVFSGSSATATVSSGTTPINASCTFNNAPTTGTLRIIKEVINNNGGTLEADDFSFQVNGGTATPFEADGQNDQTVAPGTYTVTEPAVSGYATTYDNCTSVTVTSGGTTTCTITNDDEPSYIIVDKTVVNDNGGTASPNDFLLTVDENAVLDEVAYAVNPGTHTAGETPLAGYTAGAWGGDCDVNAGVTVALGETKTCTITNDDIAPTLTFTKLATNNYGGTLGAADFPLFINGNSVTSGAPNTLLANFLYTLTETQQTGYTGGYFTGDCNAAGSISLLPGDNKSCTITNTDVQPKLTVTKVVINDNGGTKEISDFPLFVDSVSVKSGAQTGLNAGTYTVSETGDSGYTSTITGDCAPNGSVTLAAGDVKSCTITNDDQQGSIQIVKNTIGGNGTFDFTITGPSSSSPSITTSGNTGNTGLIVVNAGTYSVSETAQTGWDLTFASCDTGTTGSFTIANAQTTTCTFTNTQRGSISGYKLEEGTNTPLSGWDIQLWEWVTNDFFYSGQTDTTDANGYFSFENVVPGVYQLREVLQSGWTKIFPTGVGIDVTLDPGESDEDNNFANFENVSISGQKFNDQNGNGTKDSGEPGLSGWTIDLDKDANGSVDATTATDGSGTYSFADLTPGTYRVREVGQPGWTQTTADPGDIAILSGQDVTDVDFGNQMRGSVTIIKDAVPNNAQNFTFTSPQLGGFTLDDDSNATLSNTQVFSDLGSNTYEITENAVSGWTLTNLSCDGDNNAQIDLSGRTATVNLDQPGETITCTFTNTKYGSITGRKYDDTNGDGTKNTGEPYLDGWTVYLFDEQMQQLSSVVTGNGSFEQGQYKFTGLLPGTYFTCEELQSGWTQTDPSSGTQYNGTYCRQRTLTAGQNLTGVHFGNFQNASIIVHKNVVLPDGSSEVSDSTEFTALLNDGDPEAIAEGTDATYSDLAPGTYTVTEDTPPAGYALVSITDIGQITVTSGGTHHIYVINRQLPAALILDKLLPNDDGGDAVPEDFPVYIDGSQSFWGSHEVNAGSFTVSEDTIPGYTPSSWGQDCDGDGNVTLLPGETKTCTITNDDQPGQIKIIKNTVGGDGTFDFSIGGPSASTPRITTSNNSGDTGLITVNAGPYSITETGQSGWDLTDSSCDSGTPEGLSVANGETITCTFTNTQRGSIAGKKYEDINGNGSRGGSEPYLDGWTIHLFDTSWVQLGQMNTGDTGTTGQYKFDDLEPNTYYVCEDLQDGWSQSQPSSGETRNSTYCRTVTVDPGQSVTSQHFGNIELGVIQSRKFEDVNGDSVQSVGENWLSGWGIRLYNGNWERYSEVVTGHTGTQGQYRFENLPFDTYYICEVLQDGWAQTDPSSSEGYANLSGASDEAGRCRRFIVDSSGDESLGEKHFGNIELGNITVVKYNDHDGNGVKEDSDETLDGWEMHLVGTDVDAYQWTGAQISGQVTFSDLMPGLYTLSEQTQEGWSQTNISCDDNQDPVNLAAGEDLTCYVGNQGLGTIIVEKDVIPDSDATFDFSITGDLIGTIGFVLGDGQSTNPNYSGLPAGTYSVSETPDDLYTTDVQCVSSEDDTEVASALDLDPGETITCTFTNTRKTGDVLVHKMVRADVAGEFISADPGDFVWGLSEGVTPYAMGSTQTFDTGDYDVYENSVADFHFEGWFEGNPEENDLSCDNLPDNDENFTLPASVTVTEDGLTEITLCNARDTGTITVDKVTDPSESGQEFTIRLLQGESTVYDYLLQDTTNPETQELPTGTYTLDELDLLGWDLTSASCVVNDGDSESYTEGNPLELGYGDNITCTFTNTQRGTVMVTKYNDENGNGTRDDGEGVLSDWTMNLTGDFDESTGVDGVATFENLIPDTYTLTEELKDGWEQTELRCESEGVADDTADDTFEAGGRFVLDPGETQECVVGNRRLNPILSISKSHAASDDVKNPSENVLFTITVTATQSAAFNVFVTDLPANGFTYRANSWTANSSARGDLKALGITTQPTYASPGVWTLGDMEKDETVTLTYIADISTEQKPGIYKDLAWGYGCRFEIDCEVGDANSVLSNAVSPGVVDDNFVGTQVEISKDLQSGATLNKTEGEVLGAATELPATGANDLWIKLAALLFLVGLGLIAAGKYSRRYYV